MPGFVRTVVVTRLASGGRAMIFAGRALREIFRPPFEFSETARQVYELGWRSLPLIAAAGYAVGIVMSMHTRASLERFGAEALVPAVLALALVRETGPLVVGLLVSGRVGAGVGAELGAMKVTEQIDAYEVMAMNPIVYLAIPRIIAGMFMLPVLVVFADLIGVLSGMVAAIDRMQVSIPDFERGMREFFRTKDAFFGLSKAFCFGITITTIACYQGFKVKPGSGAEGVGQATTNTVVVSCILILCLDYLLARTIL